MGKYDNLTEDQKTVLYHLVEGTAKGESVAFIGDMLKTLNWSEDRFIKVLEELHEAGLIARLDLKNYQPQPKYDTVRAFLNIQTSIHDAATNTARAISHSPDPTMLTIITTAFGWEFARYCIDNDIPIEQAVRSISNLYKTILELHDDMHKGMTTGDEALRIKGGIETVINNTFAKNKQKAN